MSTELLIDFGFRQKMRFCRPGRYYDLAYSKSSPDIVRVAWTYPSSFVNDFSKPARMKRKQEKIKKSMYKRWKERQF